jgi:hypothetical protein
MVAVAAVEKAAVRVASGESAQPVRRGKSPERRSDRENNRMGAFKDFPL